MKGQADAKVNISYGKLYTQLKITVWYPKLPITVWVSDPVLNRIKGNSKKKKFFFLHLLTLAFSTS